MTGLEIGNRIFEVLQARCMTQRELARLSGVTEMSMHRYIYGERIPRADKLAKIAKALHVTTDSLLGLGGDKHGTGA